MNERTLRWQLLFGALILALIIPATTYAFRGGGGPCGLRDACADEIDALCPDSRGPREVHGCLREHEEEISDTCSEKLREAGQRHAAVRKACEEDVQELCPYAETRRGIRRCLRANRDGLSDECTKALESLPRRGRGWRKG